MKIFILVVLAYIFTFFPFTVQCGYWQHTLLHGIHGFLSACSCPVLVLHWGLQPFHIITLVGALSWYSNYYLFSLHMLTNFSIGISSATISAGGTVLAAFFNTGGFSPPQNFHLLCLSFPAFFYTLIPEQDLINFYIFSSLCLHPVLCELPYYLGTELPYS